MHAYLDSTIETDVANNDVLLRLEAGCLVGVHCYHTTRQTLPTQSLTQSLNTCLPQGRIVLSSSLFEILLRIARTCRHMTYTCSYNARHVTRCSWDKIMTQHKQHPKAHNADTQTLQQKCEHHSLR